MNNRPIDDLPPILAAYVEAARLDADATAIDRAQTLLMKRIGTAPDAGGKIRGPWLAAGVTAMLTLAVFLAAPLLSNGGDAFAAVRQHFLDFRVLSMHVEQRLSGRPMQSSRIVVDDQGLLRTDVGEELSVVVDPRNEQMLMLLHGSRRAVLAPLQSAPASADPSLQWLQELRDFQGQAELLPGSRVVDGEVARAWSLQIEGQQILVWATSQGLPVQMQVGRTGELQLHFRFEFEPSLPPGYLSSQVPQGYVLAEPDPH